MDLYREVNVLRLIGANGSEQEARSEGKYFIKDFIFIYF